MAKLSLGTLYEANKQIMASDKIKELTTEELQKATKDLSDFFNWQCDCYAMLYCREKSDITIFHMYENQNLDPPALAAKECIECCLNRGKIVSIEKQEDQNFEIWLQIDGDAFAYYLFPYDLGVIEV